ncbi:MAG: DUF1003 domain-containing protein [Phenylobacterium sp.]|uniref:DUF1003 domain-containing protein n=1 Tax=Phenylobacterium sp. TaxID=1871053 RepID=UPI0027326B4F|nr:DUF1003 domain-containing protein [Phenylobacterium sp.]MDP3175305.1 DUF1003 domain-containing protein [Phenylobacterium sp.]
MSAAHNQQLSQQLLGRGYEALTPIQRSVIDLIAVEEPSGINPALIIDDRKFGERLSDKVAAVGGSWAFIIAFGLILALWMGWNVLTRGGKLAFDPYPFIFLNLMLSTLAAIQAPVIMMSQNRSAKRDREAAEHDYVVNLRAELEIMHLHDKLDALRQAEMADLLLRQNELLQEIHAAANVKRAPRAAKPEAAGRKPG